LLQGIIPAFISRERGKPQKNLARKSDNTTDILPGYFSNDLRTWRSEQFSPYSIQWNQCTFYV